MAQVIESSDDYGVEVPGFGFVAGQFPYLTVGESADAIYGSTHEDALSLAATITTTYRRLGLPDIADSVRVVRRTVTVSRSDWEPVL